MAKSKPEKKPRKAASKEARPSSGRAMPRPQVLLAAVGVLLLAAIGVTVFIYRTVISDGFTTGHDAVLSHLGFGIIPTAAWLAGAIFVVKYRKQGLGHPRVWGASLPLLAAGFGILAFFSFQQGSMAYFTMDGTYGLGGKLGQWISGIYGGTGSVFGQALGAMRVTVLLFAGTALIFPVLAVAAWEITTASSMYLYIRFVMVMRGAFDAFGRRLRQRRAARAATTDTDIEESFISDVPVPSGEWQDIPATPMFDTGVPVSTPSFGSASAFSDKPSRGVAFAETTGAETAYAETPSAGAAFAETPDASATFEEGPQRRAVFGGMAKASTLEEAVQVDVENAPDPGSVRRVNGSQYGGGDDDLGVFRSSPRGRMRQIR